MKERSHCYRCGKPTLTLRRHFAEPKDARKRYCSKCCRKLARRDRAKLTLYAGANT